MVDVQDPQDITSMQVSSITDDQFRDHPIMDMGTYTQFVQFVVTDKSIPPMIGEAYWGFLDKENVLANTKEQDIKKTMNRVAYTQLAEIMSHPFGWFDWRMLVELDNMEHKVWLKATRSKDGFERRLDATQIKQIETNRVNEQKKIGIWQRMFSFGKGGKQ